jgi:hypothetical protein
MNITQQQYIADWHDDFVKYKNGLLSFIETLVILPQATDEDKRAFDQIKIMLHSKEAKEIEKNLAEGVVKQETLDKIAKFDKDLGDFAIDRMTLAPLTKEFLKKLTDCQIGRKKQYSMQRLYGL